MKLLRIIFAIASMTFFTVSCEPSSEINTTKTFRVWGNCHMCKETIEGSLKADGIASADWNVDSKIMTVSFDDKKISLDQTQKRSQL